MTTTTGGLRVAAAVLMATLVAGSVAAVGGPVRPAAAQVAINPLKIVLMGDSYAAGNGARNADGDRNYEGPGGCYRSPTNWASQYVDWLEDQGHQVTFVNRACSGGVIPHYTSRRNMGDELVSVIMDEPDASEASVVRAALNGPCRTPYPGDELYEAEYGFPDMSPFVHWVECTRYMQPQINAVGPDTDLVLMTGGGNDVSFAKIVEQCFFLGTRDPGDCRGHVDDARELLPDVQDDLTDAFAAIRARAPRANVGFVGYPYLANDDDFELVYRRLGIWESDRYAAAREVRALGRDGDQAQAEAVRIANDAARADGGEDFVTFVDDVKEHFTGHEPDPELGSGNPDRWLNEFETRIPAEWFHYNAEGHRQLGLLLREYGTFGAFPSIGTPTTSIDLAFVIDTTGSMGGAIGAVKESATAIVDQLEEGTRSFRVAVVDYRDFPDRTGEPRDYASNLVLDFSDDPVAIRAAIDSLSLGYGGDGPETMYSGLMRAIGLDWRPGVKKVALQFGDAEALDPEPTTGYVADDVIEAALAVDPVAVYGVDTGYAGAEIRSIAAATGGEVLTAPSPAQVADRIRQIIESAVDAPYAWVGTGYHGRTGQPLTFDGSGSYGPSSSLVSYEWDVDGDGVYDAVTDEPRLTHTYPADFRGLVGLRVTDGAGASALATAPVDVSVDGDGVPDASDVCPADHDPGQGDEDGDGVGDVCDADWALPTEDLPGVGVASGPPPTAEILGGPYSGAVGRPVVVRGVVGDPEGDVVASTWLPDGPCTVADARALTTTVTCTAAGTHVLRLIADDGNGGVVAAETTVEVGGATFGFDGFEPPLSGPGPMRANAGRAIPVKFRVTGAGGAPVNDPAVIVGLHLRRVACSNGAPLDPGGMVVDGDEARARGDGRWIINWKTSKALAGTCQVLTVVLSDGVMDGRGIRIDFG